MSIEPLERNYVLDTSVWINLLATEATSRILALISAQFIVPPQIYREIVRCPVTEQRYTENDHPLRDNFPISAVTLSDREMDIFIELVSGRSVAKLGDGEAAAIAVAAERNAVLVIDENKARRVVGELFPHVFLSSSAELLTCEEVLQGLGVVEAAACYERALDIGGMHPVTR